MGNIRWMKLVLWLKIRWIVISRFFNPPSIESQVWMEYPDEHGIANEVQTVVYDYDINSGKYIRTVVSSKPL